MFSKASWQERRLHTSSLCRAYNYAWFNSYLTDILPSSPTEQDIVRHEGSCYVLGRSGTGYVPSHQQTKSLLTPSFSKTTAMLFKMLAVQRAYDATRGDGTTPRPRQLFVTRAIDLAGNIERRHAKLSMSHTADQRTARGSTKLAGKQIDKGNWDLFENDEEEIRHGTLPLAFSELTDEHFPLFITFDHVGTGLTVHIVTGFLTSLFLHAQLCQLLETDQDRARTRTSSASGHQVDTNSRENMLERQKSFVSYHKFLRQYWHHLPQNMAKTLSA